MNRGNHSTKLIDETLNPTYHELDIDLQEELAEILRNKPREEIDTPQTTTATTTKTTEQKQLQTQQQQQTKSLIHIEVQEGSKIDEDNDDDDDADDNEGINKSNRLKTGSNSQHRRNKFFSQNNNNNNNSKRARSLIGGASCTTNSRFFSSSTSDNGFQLQIHRHRAVEEQKEQIRSKSLNYRDSLARSITDKLDTAEALRTNQRQQWLELRQGFGGRAESWLAKIILITHLVNSNWEKTLNEMKARDRLRRLLIPMLKLKLHVIRKRRFYEMQVVKPQQQQKEELEERERVLNSKRRATRVDDETVDLDDVDSLRETLNRGRLEQHRQQENNTQQIVDENNNNNDDDDDDNLQNSTMNKSSNSNLKPSAAVLSKMNPILHRWPPSLVEQLVSEMQPRAFLSGSQPLVRGQDPRGPGGLFFFVSVGRLTVGEDMAMRASLVHREKIVSTTSENNSNNNNNNENTMNTSGPLPLTHAPSFSYHPHHLTYLEQQRSKNNNQNPQNSDSAQNNNNDNNNNKTPLLQSSASFRSSPTNLELQTTLLMAHQATQIEQKQKARRMSTSLVHRAAETFVMATYRLSAGEYYGEIPILCGDRFNASVRCVTNCILYCVPGNRFWELVTNQSLMAKRSFNLCLHATKLILKLQVETKPSGEDLKGAHSMFACWPNAALNELLRKHAYPLILMKGELLTKDVYNSPCAYYVDNGELRYHHHHHNNAVDSASTFSVVPFKSRSVIGIQSFSRYEMSQFFEDEEEIKRRKKQEKMKEKQEHIKSIRRSARLSLHPQSNSGNNKSNNDDNDTNSREGEEEGSFSLKSRNNIIKHPPGVSVVASELSVVWAFPIEDMVRLVKKFPALEPKVVEAAGEMVFDATMRRATTLIRQLKPFQHNLRPRNLYYLQELFHPLVAVAGSVLCRAGGEVAEVFIVVEGTVQWQKREYHETLDDLTMERKNVFETTYIRTSGPGDTVGLAECLIGKQFAHWCVAERSVILLRAKASHIQKVMESRFSEENAWSIVFSVMNDREKQEARARQKEAESKRLVTMSVLPVDTEQDSSSSSHQHAHSPSFSPGAGQDQQQSNRTTKHLKTRQEQELEELKQKQLLKQKAFEEKHPSLAKLNRSIAIGAKGGRTEDEFFAPPGAGVDVNAAKKLCQQRVVKEIEEASRNHERREYQRTHRPPSPHSEWLASTLEARRVDLRRLAIEQRVMTSISTLVFGDRTSAQDKFVAEYFGDSISAGGTTLHRSNGKSVKNKNKQSTTDSSNRETKRRSSAFSENDDDGDFDDDEHYDSNDHDDTQQSRSGNNKNIANLGDFYKNSARRLKNEEQEEIIPPVKIKRMYPDFNNNIRNTKQDQQTFEKKHDEHEGISNKSEHDDLTNRKFIVDPLLTKSNNSKKGEGSEVDVLKQRQEPIIPQKPTTAESRKSPTVRFVPPTAVDSLSTATAATKMNLPSQPQPSTHQQQLQQQHKSRLHQPPHSDLDVSDPVQQKFRDNHQQNISNNIKKRTLSPPTTTTKLVEEKNFVNEEQNLSQNQQPTTVATSNVPVTLTLEQVIIENKTKKQFKESEAFSRHRREADVSDELERYSSAQLNSMAMDFLVSNCSALTRKKFVPLKPEQGHHMDEPWNPTSSKAPRLPPIPETARSHQHQNQTSTQTTARHPRRTEQLLVSKTSLKTFHSYRNQERMKTDELLLALLKPPTE